MSYLIPFDTMGQTQRGYSMPFDTLGHRAGLGEGELAGGRSVAAWECAGHWAVRAALTIALFGTFFSSVLLLLLFPSFAILLNCPYPYP